jgi:hypothetical protein
MRRIRANAAARVEEPDLRYVTVDRGQPENEIVSRMRVGSSARVPLDTAGGAESRTQGVVRLDRVEYARSWRVTLGEPTIEGEQVTAMQGGNVPNIAWNVNPALALIEWGIQGATFNAEVDWGRGCSLVLSAEYINVVVQALNLVGTPLTPNPAVAIFPCAITGCESLSAPTSAPTRSVYSGVIAPAGVANIKVPAFAKRVRIVRILQANPAEAFQLAFYADAAKAQRVWLDNGITIGNFTTNLNDTGGPNVIPPQAIVMEIANLGAVNQSYMVIFELELG